MPTSSGLKEAPTLPSASDLGFWPVCFWSPAREPRGGEATPGKGRANRVAVVTAFAARRSDGRSVRRPARPGRKGEPARAAEGGVEAPPAALIAAWLERDVLREGPGRLGGGSNVILPSRENSVMSEGGSPGRVRSGRGGAAVGGVRQAVRGVLAGRGAFLRPALSGCHCSARAGRGCEGDELGSLWTPPPTDWNQRAGGAVRGDVVLEMVGGGGFAAAEGMGSRPAPCGAGPTR